MKFKIEDGSDHISIGLSDIGSYFRFDNPLSVVWNDNQGSVGKYFCLLPYNKTYRDELENKLLASLNRDFSDNIEELHDLLKPLFSLFKNGEYNLSFSRENVFQYTTSADDFANFHYHPLELAFTEATNIEVLEEVKQKHQTFLEANGIDKKFYASSILDHTTYNLYDPTHCFFATQPDTCIDQSRVDYFEQQIADGERPFVIVMQAACYQLDMDSSYFIIDGHHKLLAYQKSGIYPAMALITYLPASAEEIEFDAEKLSTLLYPWQVENMLENWDGKDNYIIEKLKDPDSPLHQFIKNGHVKEYHPNKKPKHEAFYINDKVDGKLLEWYDNGQLKHERYYSNGKRIGIWKDYYPSGKIQFVQPFDDMNRYNGDLISYYESGQKRWIQSLINGKNVDGFTYLCWFENGDKEAELRYLHARIVERKNWNSSGRLINHEVYDEEQKKLVKKVITVHSSYQNKQNQSPPSPDKGLNIIRERQYPGTTDMFTWRTFALILFMLLQLLRMCH